MPTEPARVGIIGAGNISDAYLRSAKAFDNFEIRAVADLDRQRAEAKAATYGAKDLTVAELLAADDIDLIINLTVPAAHAAVSRTVLEAGKHVYSEKPLASDRVDAEALLLQAEQRGLRVGCAPDTFLGAGMQSAREALDSGLIGEPVAATAFMMSSGPEHWHPDPAFFYAVGAGPLFDMAPYYLTALVNLFGPIERLSGSAVMGRKQRPILSKERLGQHITVETPTHVSAQLEFRAGPAATLLTSFDSLASELPRCEVYGTEGTLSLPDPNTFGGPLRLKRANDDEWQTLASDRPYSENLRGLGVAEMVAALAEDRPQRASGALAYHVLDAMSSVLEAAAGHHWVELTSTCTRPEPLSADVRF